MYTPFQPIEQNPTKAITAHKVTPPTPLVSASSPIALPAELTASVLACEANRRSDSAPQASRPRQPAANAMLRPAPATGREKCWVSTR